jgi:hypothetical protein
MSVRFRTVCATRLLLLLLLLLPAAAQAQFNYSYNSDGTITITGYTGSGGAVTIPSTINGVPVTIIGDSAFRFLSSLTSVRIPDSVTSIGGDLGGGAFGYCSNLTNAMIGNSVTIIGDNTFHSCTSLTSVTIGKSVTIIGTYAFGGCTSLTSVIIPDSVTSIGSEAFTGCYGLTNATIGNSVTSIGSFAFGGGCIGLTSVSIPDSVTSIGGGAFTGCTGLTSVTIPDSVTSMGDQAFEGCTSLTNATIGNSVISIGDVVFAGCTGLTRVAIPNSVTSIGNGAFVACTSLTNATIGNSVASIGSNAFNDCTSLIGVHFLGSAPSGGSDSSIFASDNNATVYYSPCTTGWGTTFGGRPTAPDQSLVTVTVTANPSPGGSVTGSGRYWVCSSQQISANANSGWAFTGWSDGSTDNPRTITVPAGGATYTASFSQTAVIAVQASPSTGGSVGGTGTYLVGTNVQISAGANSCWTFTSWNDGNAQNPRTITVPAGGALYTANFQQASGTITVEVNPANGGIANGGGSYPCGSSQQISASANSGWTFTGWGDGNSSNPRTITVPSGGATYVATFFANLTVTKLQTTLNFVKNNADSCTVKGTFNLPESYSFVGKTVTLDIGGAQVSFALGSRGSGMSGMSLFNKPTFNKKTGLWTINATLKNGSWQTVWADYSMISSNIPKPGVLVVNFPVRLVLDTETFIGTTNLHYTATAGKSGTAK